MTKTGTFELSDYDYVNLVTVYENCKTKLPLECNSFESFCGELVMKGVIAWAQDIKQFMGI